MNNQNRKINKALTVYLASDIRAKSESLRNILPQNRKDLKLLDLASQEQTAIGRGKMNRDRIASVRATTR